MKLPSKEKCLEWAKEIRFMPYAIIMQPEKLEALIHRAYKEGAEAMREEAAKVLIDFYDSSSTRNIVHFSEAIRNLKVEE